MADTQYVTENRLTTEAYAAQRRTRQNVLVLSIPVVVLCSIAAPALGGIALVLMAFLYFTRQPDKIITAGANGEDIALKVLCQLPDSYAIFNQIDVPNAQSRTGVNEIDLLICGPTAIFVIEVKHNNGVIGCDETWHRWPITKTSRRGSTYEKEMRNPIGQVKKLVWLLSGYLKQQHAKPWIQGLVVFTNPNAELLHAGSLSVPVLRVDEVLSYIQNFQSRPNPFAQRAVKEIAILKSAHGAP
jgi:hypothetical protein